MTTSATETFAQKHFRLGVEASKERAEAATAATRETLLEFLSDIDTPSPKLIASINACEDIAKLKATIRRAAKLTTLKGFKF